jgi:hypothetical protein
VPPIIMVNSIVVAVKTPCVQRLLQRVANGRAYERALWLLLS